MSRKFIFTGHYGNPKIKVDSLEGKSSEVIHTLFGFSSLPDTCLYFNDCPVKSCKPNCRIENFYSKWGTEYLR